MGFFKNIGVSYEYLYDLMSFDSTFVSDIGSYEPNSRAVVENTIVKEKSGFCIRIRRKGQKRARTLRFSYIDIIRLIETETPELKDKKISRILFSPSYIHNTTGYSGKSIFMRIDFGDLITGSTNGFLPTLFPPTYQVSHLYILGHKYIDIIS